MRVDNVIVAWFCCPLSSAFCPFDFCCFRRFRRKLLVRRSSRRSWSSIEKSRKYESLNKGNNLHDKHVPLQNVLQVLSILRLRSTHTVRSATICQNSERTYSTYYVRNRISADSSMHGCAATIFPVRRSKRCFGAI